MKDRVGLQRPEDPQEDVVGEVLGIVPGCP